ncbi:ATP synthase-coupling factor 6, mitochondrial [Collichthys lucidus]|uniref:ATP synthase peripheral stalk subunit F6, mitochondrial n=1 Tax=Collichthys lucidus TaxID=240159 RepID=A0A4U5VD27_COLLU|nr:ATP synthase-coupling factor 6, mitochondrial [Collichthys lucidus]
MNKEANEKLFVKPDRIGCQTNKHLKDCEKAKPQPALDVAKLLEQLFSQCRPGTAPPHGKARPTKGSSMPFKPPTISSKKVSTSNVPPLSDTAASSVPPKTTSTFNAAPLSPQPKSASSTNPKTFSKTPQHGLIQGFAADSVTLTSPAPASLGPEAAAIGGQTSTEAIKTNVETATEPFELKTDTVLPLSAAIVEPSIETTTELPVEPIISHVETLAAVVEGPVEPTVDVPAEDVQTKGTDSGVADILQTAKVEPSIETTTELPVEPFLSHVETLDGRAAVVEGPVEPTVDVPAEDVQTKGTDSGVVDVLQSAKEESLIETTIDLPVESSHVPLETLESRAADAVGPVEPAIDVTVEAADQSTNSGVADISHTASVELLLETTVDPPVDATVDALAIQTNSTDSGVVVVTHSAKDEPLIETTIEAVVEASTLPLESGAAVSKGPVEPTIDKEAADNLSHTALVQDVQESAPLPLTNEAESTSGSVALEEGVNRSEQMTLESVTLHVVRGLVGSLKTQELLQTKDALDEEAEKQLQELLVQTGTEAENKAAAETGSSSEDESEDLTKALSKWVSLSEDLQELEGESTTLVTEHLCHVPAVLSKTPAVVETSSTSDPAVVAEVLLETRNALEKEAEALANEEKMEVKTTIEDGEVFEDTTEVDILTLDSISEATEAIEAETSIIMEAMFGSEQGQRQPPDTLLVVQTEDSREQEGTLEAMTLESVTLAEVEASFGTLENESLSETTDYLEKEAEIIAEEKKMEIYDAVASEEMAEAPKIKSLFLPEDDALSEALQTDTLMEELLFSVPGHVTGVTEDQISQEVVRMDISNVATGSIDADSATAVTDDFPASPAVKEVLLGQDEGAQTAALGNEDVKGEYTCRYVHSCRAYRAVLQQHPTFSATAGSSVITFRYKDLDPVQRLFLEKIKEYDNMHRLSGGLLEAEPDYVKYLSEETVKLQRLYGGGDLSSFPEFTFTGKYKLAMHPLSDDGKDIYTRYNARYRTRPLRVLLTRQH